MIILVICSQIAISVLTVAIYHGLVARRRQPSPAPPVIVAPPVVRPPLAPPPVPVPLRPPPVPVAPVAPVSDESKYAPRIEATPPEIVAVIAAAIAVVIGKPHRVISVQHGTVQMPAVNVWAMEGRVEQFMSHKVR